MKAMILAAGFGTRMGALTEETSKVLLPVAGKALIEYHLENLRACGVKEVVINLHHHAEKIANFLGDGQAYGLTICYSFENEILGTGGGVYYALDLLGAEPFLLISADMWTDYPLPQLPKTIDDDAHIVLVPNPSFHPQGDFQLIDGRVKEKAEHNYTYASLGVFRPEFFQANQRDIGPLFTQAILNERISGEIYRGKWANLNTPAELNKLEQQLTAH